MRRTTRKNKFCIKNKFKTFIAKKFKTLLAHKSRLVLFFESSAAPDAIVLKLLKQLTLAKNTQLTNVLVVCQLTLSHKRLENKENLQVLFSLKKHQKTVFAIEKICIQKNPATLHSHESENQISFSPQELFQLIPVFIQKPWGQEIWYSGIESRGVSKIKPFSMNSNIAGTRSLIAGTVPLSWIVGSVPTLIFGKKFAHKDPILLKILDPLPQEIIGDLYYELHLEKNEVYVVTDIHGSQNSQSSHHPHEPDGTREKQGKIKIGINADKLKAYNNDKQKYKTDFLNSILAYEKIRREIDTINDAQKHFAQDTQISVQTSISDALINQEVILRKHMNSFCGFLNLQIGDIIHVPTHMPHALQHGVKVIEFQTPTYERLIISFAQKVLTQAHWDTKKAFDVINLEPFQKQTLKILSKSKTILKELVCTFPDFQVVRWTLDPNISINDKIKSKFNDKTNHKIMCKIAKKSYYRILFIVNGTFVLNKNKILAGMCIFVPAHAEYVLSAEEKGIFLLAEPR